MYEELVKRLRLAKAVLSRNKDLIALLSDAADAIEKLSAIHDEQKAQIILVAAEIGEQKPRWIGVDEALPKNKRETYLILTDGGYECDARWTDNVYGLRQSDRWGWNIFDIPKYSKVTHWMPRMPLPEPPKEES